MKATTPKRDPFTGGGEMGALMRQTDWSATGLGPPEAWPQSLRTMLGVVLGSRFPMLLWWGPNLLHLYNDAYRPILRDKHPASLAAPAATIWAEVWDLAGPMAEGVQAGGPATWTEDLQLFIQSGGMLEETYFTFSYSPVPGDDGEVGGLLNTVQETTAKVQGERGSTPPASTTCSVCAPAPSGWPSSSTICWVSLGSRGHRFMANA